MGEVKGKKMDGKNIFLAQGGKKRAAGNAVRETITRQSTAPVSFNELAVGDCFRVLLLPGVYFKTGEGSYGVAPGEPEWDAADLAGLVIRPISHFKFEISKGTKVIEVDFESEIPPKPGSGALNPSSLEGCDAISEEAA